MKPVARSAPPRPPAPWRWVWAFILPERGDRLRPTLAGYLLGAVAGLLAAAAYNNASNILFLSLSLVISMGLLDAALSWANFWRLRWRAETPAGARAGEPTVARLVVENARRALPVYAMRFEFTAAGGPPPAPVRVATLAAGGRHAAAVSFTPMRRGRASLRVTGASSSHPFGLLFKTLTRGDAAEGFTVWPARVPYAFDPTGGRRLQREGDTHRKGGGTELVGIRDYRPGDAPRTIHWKASAKRGRLLVREMSEPGEAAYAVVLDAADFVAAPGAWEKGIACAASLAEDLYAAGRLTAAGTDETGPVRVRNAADLHRFLDTLAALPETPSPRSVALTRLAAETLKITPGPGDVVHILHGTRRIGEA